MQYKKPAAVLEREKAAKVDRLRAVDEPAKGGSEGALDAQAEQCKQQ